jgi:hypothetical protein
MVWNDSLRLRPSTLPMKAFIYAIFTTLALALLVVATASAQAPVHPTDPNAVLIGTFEVTVTISSGGTALMSWRARPPFPTT